MERLGDWIAENGERALPWLEAQRAARRAKLAPEEGPWNWPRLIPAFATHVADMAERAANYRVDDQRLRIEIDLAQLNDEVYLVSLLDQAKAWRAGSSQSTIYVFSYDEPVPQQLISTVRNAADGALRAIHEPRSFPKCNAVGESRCLYVGHSFKIETRLRDHLGFGSAGTSSLHLIHWDGHPQDALTFTAYRISSNDGLLAQLLEEYLWDQLRPLLGKRGGR